MGKINLHSVVFKIILILAFMSIVTVAVGIIGSSQINQMSQVSNDVFKSSTSVLFPLSDLMELINLAEHEATAAVQLNDGKAVSAFMAALSNINGQVGNFQFTLPEKTYRTLETDWKNFNKAGGDLQNDLTHHNPSNTSYPAFFVSANQFYESIFALNKKLRVQGLDTFSSGKKVYQSVIQLQSGVTVIGVFIAIVIGLLAAFSIVRPLQQLQKKTGLLAEGDLRVRVNLKSKDEVGRVGDAFNHAIGQLHAMVTDSSEYAKVIDESGHSLFRITEETSRSLGELNKLVSDLTQGASEQTVTIDGTLKTIQKAVAETMSVTQKTIAINECCQACAVTAGKGKEASAAVSEVIQNVVEHVQKIQAVVHKLADDLKQIQDLVNAIAGIAEKTKLLSLNASIEAARAGDHGRGFAVVASNIRQLATQAQESVDHINAVIETIYTGTDLVVSTVESGTTEAQKGSRTVSETVRIFQELVGQVDQITQAIQEITSTVFEMKEGNQAVITEMDKVVRISENNMAAVSQVAATFQEQYASTVSVTEAARELQNLAEELTATAANFKV